MTLSACVCVCVCVCVPIVDTDCAMRLHSCHRYCFTCDLTTEELLHQMSMFASGVAVMLVGVYLLVPRAGSRACEKTCTPPAAITIIPRILIRNRLMGPSSHPQFPTPLNRHA